MRTKTTLQAYLFLAPALLLMLAFSFWPVGFGSFIAFTQYNLIDSPRWVGLDNFRELFADDLFLASLKNSTIYLLVVPVIQIVAMLLAVLVNNQLPAIKWFRAAYYLPVVTSVSVIGIIWNFMYTEDGVLNAALHWLRVVNEPVGWLNDDRIARCSR
ncbi:sugar ABC transporter permease [Chromobacterium haemolyticum]|nr:sugar ABC transporter permease [Chromobacterium haemolyticum]